MHVCILHRPTALGTNFCCSLQVSILVEGQPLPLAQLAQQISSTLSTSGSGAGNPAADVSVTKETGTSSSQAAAEPHGAAAGAVTSDAASVLVIRNIIQDVASRRSYGLQDGELCGRLSWS